MLSYVAYICYTTQRGAFFEGIPLPFNLSQTDGVFFLILLCFLSFTHVYKGGISFLKDSVSLILSADRNERPRYEKTTKEIWYTTFLMLQFAILVSICLYNSFAEFKMPRDGDLAPFGTIALFVLLITAFFAFKYVLLKLAGYVLNKPKEIETWGRAHTAMTEMLGVIYFIPTILLIYSNYWHQYIVGFMLILFLLAQIVLFYRLILYFIREKFNFLFLIAYLCTVEFIPYIFLVLGLIYLYQSDMFSVLW